MLYLLAARCMLAGALVKLAEEGVQVRVLTDATEARNVYSQVNYLRRNKVLVCLGNTTMHHHKTVIIGKNCRVNGSMNWSKAGLESNEENTEMSHRKESKAANNINARVCLLQCMQPTLQVAVLFELGRAATSREQSVRHVRELTALSRRCRSHDHRHLPPERLSLLRGSSRIASAIDHDAGCELEAQQPLEAHEVRANRRQRVVRDAKLHVRVQRRACVLAETANFLRAHDARRVQRHGRERLFQTQRRRHFVARDARARKVKHTEQHVARLVELLGEQKAHQVAVVLPDRGDPIKQSFAAYLVSLAFLLELLTIRQDAVSNTSWTATKRKFAP